MFVKHIIKNLHVSVAIVWPSSGVRLSCLVLLLPSLLVCVVYLVCGFNVVYVCACLMYLPVGCLVVHNQTSHRQVHQARTHIDNIKATYQINDANKQKSSNSTKHERRPPKDGQTIVTETCRVLMMCFTNIFNNLEF